MAINETDSRVTLISGNSSVTMLKYGATIISWKVEGEEKLFLSEKAIIDGSKPVRGGIPLVFPVFGKRTDGPFSALAQHGFARKHTWDFLGQTTESPLAIQFGLGPEQLTADARKAWNFDFTLIFTVRLEDTKLTTALQVENTGAVPFDFNALFHTYLRVEDVNNVSVKGLSGVKVHDKVSQLTFEESGNVAIEGEVDRVYSDVAPAPVTVTGHGDPLFEFTERVNLPDVVVWNPWIDRANELADFYPKAAYKNMLCIEAGMVSHFQSVKPGTKWECSQTVRAVDSRHL